MADRYLREKEFNSWKDNHWLTHCENQAKFEGKTSTSLKWLKMINLGAFLLLLGLFIGSLF